MGQKHPDNPVIDGSSRDPTQSYPPTVIKIDNTYFCITKTEAADLVGFTSDNGVTWKETSKHVLKRSIAGWDQRKVSSPLLRYDPDHSKYHLYYSGTTTDGTKSVGYAASERPLSGYKKPPENPICGPTDINNELDAEYESIIVSDVARVDDDFIYYGTARSSKTESIIWVANGDDWTDIGNFEKLLSQSDTELGSLLQSPSIISVDGTYIMQFTAGENAEVLDERRLYIATGETPYDFELRCDPILKPSKKGSWEERRVYGAQWLKKQDGRYLQPDVVDGTIRLYYSGHDLGHHTAPAWKQKLHHPSIGAYYELETQSLPKIIARYLLTKVRWHGSSIFDYNRGYTGLAGYDPEELI